MSFKIGIIGFGLIGKKRMTALENKHEILAIADSNSELFEPISENIKCFDDWRNLISIDEIDLVVVCTRHDSLSEICIEAAKKGKHILVEKPAGRNVDELLSIKEAVDDNKVNIHVGFNHRYHPSLIKAREIIDSGTLGELMFIRGRYGHGGRIGYEKEWRANKDLSGGGELIDQGVHLIDLAMWFLGDFQNVSGFLDTLFWDMEVEDNAFMTLRTEDGKVAFLHASCSEWKNMFSFEIYGKDGKISIEGLGGSYGLESLTLYKMLPQMGPPETQSWSYPFQDNSWETETEEFIENIMNNETSASDINNAISVMKIVDKLYKENKK